MQTQQQAPNAAVAAPQARAPASLQNPPLGMNLGLGGTANGPFSQAGSSMQDALSMAAFLLLNTANGQHFIRQAAGSLQQAQQQPPAVTAGTAAAQQPPVLQQTSAAAAAGMEQGPNVPPTGGDVWGAAPPHWMQAMNVSMGMGNEAPPAWVRHLPHISTIYLFFPRTYKKPLKL